MLAYVRIRTELCNTCSQKKNKILVTANFNPDGNVLADDQSPSIDCMDHTDNAYMTYTHLSYSKDSMERIIFSLGYIWPVAEYIMITF